MHESGERVEQIAVCFSRGSAPSGSARENGHAPGGGLASPLRRARHFSANRSSVSFKTSSVSSAYLLRSHRSSWIRGGEGLANNFFKIGKAASTLPWAASNASQNASSKRLIGPSPPPPAKTACPSRDTFPPRW